MRLKEKPLEGLLNIPRIGLKLGKKGFESPGSDTYQLHEIVAALVPALEIEVRSREGANGLISCVKPNDWRDMPDRELLRRISPFGRIYFYESADEYRLLPVTAADGNLLGRCSLVDGWMGGGVVVVNGVYAGKINLIWGLLMARQNLDLARTQAIPIAGVKEMGDWVNRQRQLLQQDNSMRFGTHLAVIALALGGDVADCSLVGNLDRFFNQEEFRELAGKHHELWFVEGLRNYDSKEDAAFLPSEFEQDLRIKPHCLLGDRYMWGRANFLDANGAWPLPDDSIKKPQSIGDVIAAILTEAWGDGDMEEPDEPQIVGEVNGNPVRRKVKIFRKTP